MNDKNHERLDQDEVNKEIHSYLRGYEPIESHDILEISNHISNYCEKVHLKYKWSQLDKIINLYAGELDWYNSVILRKWIRSRVYSTLGLKWWDKLVPKWARN